jgi:hypothetical protein
MRRARGWRGGREKKKRGRERGKKKRRMLLK